MDWLFYMLTNEHIPVRIEPASYTISLHANDCCDADIKPNNIFANNSTGSARFGTIQLGDFRDSVPCEIATNNGDHIIGAPIYRAPEVMLNVRWTVAVDIWSLGATASCNDPHQ
jgi:casein kinase II subunit alpha